jgi:hypothetical protein
MTQQTSSPSATDTRVQWYFSTFLNHFLPRVPLSLLVLLCLAIPFVGSNNTYGIDKLVWHEGTVEQFLVGLSMALLVSGAFSIGHLLWLRDLDEGRLPPGTEPCDYGAYAKGILFSLLATVLIGVVSYASTTWARQRGLATSVDLRFCGLVGLGLGGALLVWQLAPRWKQGKTGLVAVLVGHVLLVGLVVWIDWATHTGALEEGEPLRLDYAPLIAGCVAGGWLVALGRWLTGGSAQADEVEGSKKEGNSSASDTTPARAEGRWWTRLVKVMLVLVWFGVLVITLREESYVGTLFTVLGLGLVVWYLVHPNEALRTPYRAANVIVAVALLTWVPGQRQIDALSLLVLLPVSIAAFITLVAFVRWTSQATPPVPEAAPAKPADPSGDGRPPISEQADAARAASWVFLVGWFTLLGFACSPWASPVVLVCGLLFGVVGVYGLIAYTLRGAAIPTALALALLALLSGGNLYKFRFPDPLHGLYSGGKDKPLPLKDLQARDEGKVAEATHQVAQYYQLLREHDLLAYQIQDIRESLGQKGSEDFAQDEAAIAAEAERRIKRKEAERQLLKGRMKDILAAAKKEWPALTRELKLIEPPYPPEFLAEWRKDVDGQKAGEKGLLQPEHTAWGDSEFGESEGGPQEARVKKPLILIAVSGGGLRAAVWTHLLLGRLERAFAAHGKDFPAHVRIVTGASGGMLGATYYVSALQKPGTPGRKTGGERWSELDTHVERLRKDSVTPLMRQFVFGDIPNFFSPWPAKFDRGQALEEAWAEHLKGALSGSFHSLREGEQQGWRPSLVFAPMMVEDGRRLLISNLSLHYPIRNDGPLLLSGDSLRRELLNCGVAFAEAKGRVMADRGEVRKQLLAHRWRKELDRLEAEEKRDLAGFLCQAIDERRPLPEGYRLPRDDSFSTGTYSIEAFELFRLFPDTQDTLKLSTAVRMSASFPYFAPAVSLPTNPRRRVVDAGYYDNYGVSLSAAWLFSGRNRQWLLTNTDRVCLIQIRDGVADDSRKLESVSDDQSTDVSRGLEELFTPLEGLDNARIGSSSFRNDGQLELLASYLQSLNPRIDFMVANFEYSGSACLNWRLSQSEYNDLREEATKPKVDSRIEAMMDYLFPLLVKPQPKD